MRWPAEGILSSPAVFSPFADPRRSMSYACGRQRGCGFAGKRNLPPAGHLMGRTENERFGVKDFFEFPTRYEANH